MNCPSGGLCPDHEIYRPGLPFYFPCTRGEGDLCPWPIPQGQGKGRRNDHGCLAVEAFWDLGLKVRAGGAHHRKFSTNISSASIYRAFENKSHSSPLNLYWIDSGYTQSDTLTTSPSTPHRFSTAQGREVAPAAVLEQRKASLSLIFGCVLRGKSRILYGSVYSSLGNRSTNHRLKLLTPDLRRR